MVHPEKSVKSQVAIATRDDVSLQTVSLSKPKPKPVEKPTPKPVVKPTVISESDLVGQILLQGFGSSGKKSPSQWPGTSASTVVKTTASEKKSQAKPTISQKPSTTIKVISDLAAKLEKTKKTTGPNNFELKQEPKPPKPAVKSSVISKSDLVGQILLQGCGSSRKQPITPATTVRANSTNIQKTSSDKATVKDTRMTIESDNHKATKSRTAATCVSWDMNKIVAPRATEKRPRDVLDESIQDEMNAKRQRLAQWLGNCVSIISASARQQQNGMCAQRRFRTAWASVQSDQSLLYPHEISLDP